MPSQIQISSSQLRDLRVIYEIGAENLRRVIEKLASLLPLPLAPQTLHLAVFEVLQDDAQVNALMRPIFALVQLIRQREMSVEEVLEGLRDGVGRAEPEWAEAEKRCWNEEVEPQLHKLLQSPSIRTVSKALDLAYDHANLLQGIRIVTDIRPVFNDDGEDLKVDGAVVAFVMRLNYDSRDGNHSLSIALDETDILNLARQCQRALDKAEIASRRMIDDAKINTVVSGARDESNKCI